MWYNSQIKPLLLYLLVLFLLMGISPFLPADGQMAYLSVAIIGAGLIAILFQKKAHGGKFVDMGFRLNRNALIGIGIALVFTSAAIFVNFGLPYLLGLAEFSLNEESAAFAPEVPAIAVASSIAVIGGAIMFVSCLFGEELAFRGYVLPKLEERYGSVKAILLCSLIFAVWHLPAYFSIYSDGASDSGWRSTVAMLFAHGISVVPICILYLTTRELYGVSLYHAAIDVFQYSIVRNPELGDASRDAVYNMTVLSEPTMVVIGWGWHIVAIFLMIGLCRVAKNWTLTRASSTTLNRSLP